MIEAREVSFDYNGSPVLEKASFSARPGRITVLMGPNGSGKTTLLKIVAWLLQPTSGHVLASGKDVATLSKRELGRWRRDVGFVFQEPYLFNMPVTKNLAYPLEVRGLDQHTIEESVASIIEIYGLERIAGKRPHQLSGGDKKRVEFARASISSPGHMLLDEPTVSVDPENCLAIEASIKRLRDEGRTVIITTHDASQARRLADDFAFLYKGRVAEFGGKDSLVANPKQEMTRKFLNGDILVERRKEP